MTHDRVYAFAPRFSTHLEAARFATAQALRWIAQPVAGLAAAPHVFNCL